MARLFRVIVPVGDIEEASRFYGAVLFAEGERVSPGRHYFECEGTILACYDPSTDGDEAELVTLTEPLYFAVDDLEGVLAAVIDAGGFLPPEVIPDVGALGRIETRPWGERSFYASDPFGNPLCFVSRDTAFTGDPDSEE